MKQEILVVILEARDFSHERFTDFMDIVKSNDYKLTEEVEQTRNEKLQK
jgi:hypothetical protein